jgi:hypothetical protein
MTTIESAADVLGTPPDLPQGTPATPAAAPAPAAPPASTPDKAGQVWDARYHDPRQILNAHGCWAKLRGNAARKAKGLPPSGATTGKAFRPAAPAPESGPTSPEVAPTAQPAPDPAPTASQPPPPELTGAAPPPIRDGVPVGPEAMPEARPLEAYQATAVGLVDGASTVAQLTMGNAWILKPEESRGLTGAVQRVLHHYQLPVVGPLVELALVLLPIIGRRRNDPQTRDVVGNVLAWFKRKGQPAPTVDPYRAMPAPGSSAPVDATPAAYRDGPPAMPQGEGKRVMWIP